LSPRPLNDEEQRRMSPRPLNDEEQRRMSPRPINDEEQRRIETEYAKSRCLINLLKNDKTLLELFNMIPHFQVIINDITT